MYRRLLIDPPENLCETWLLWLEERDAMLADGLDAIEEATGQKITHSRFGEYRNGVRPIPWRIALAMAEQSAPTLFRQLGLTCTEADAKAIARSLHTRGTVD